MWRIRRVDRACAKLVALTRRGGSRLSTVVRIMVDSGLLYTLFIVASCGAELAGSNAIYISCSMVRLVPPLI